MTSPPVALITGAARRIGAEIARTLHEAGAKVVAHYRHSAAEAERLMEELNSIRPASAACVQGDLRDAASVDNVVRETVSRFGRLDILVNNASTFYATPIGKIDERAWEDLIGANLKGPMFLAQAAVPHLQASQGCIVNICDIHAERPLSGYAVYCVAKAGLLGLTRALAVELAPRIRVNCVSPGAILWPQEATGFPASKRAAIIEHALLKRVGEPADIARAVKYLAFDAPYVTGQIINVDGGRTAYL
jgi:pteridine reductase